MFCRCRVWYYTLSQQDTSWARSQSPYCTSNQVSSCSCVQLLKIFTCLRQLRLGGTMDIRASSCREGSDLPEASMRLRCSGDKDAISTSIASKRSWMAGLLLAERCCSWDWLTLRSSRKPAMQHSRGHYLRSWTGCTG